MTFDEFRPRFDEWVDSRALPLVQAARGNAQRNGLAYFAGFREAEGIRGGARARRGPDLDPEQFRIGMRATLLTSLARGKSLSIHAETEDLADEYLDEASDHALETATGSAIRHALDGDRLTVIESIRTDRVAQGYTRVTDANACEFCEMLAGRGAVYSAESVEFEAHDKCGCSAEPSFD